MVYIDCLLFIRVCIRKSSLTNTAGIADGAWLLVDWIENVCAAYLFGVGMRKSAECLNGNYDDLRGA